MCRMTIEWRYRVYKVDYKGAAAPINVKCHWQTDCLYMPHIITAAMQHKLDYALIFHDCYKISDALFFKSVLKAWDISLGLEKNIVI